MSMNRYLFNIVLSLFISILSVNAQSVKHMKFMGIPINGNAEVFCEKLMSRGFSRDVGDVKNAYCLVGKFYDEDANLQVDYDPCNNVVYSVTVFIVKDGSLSSLSVYPIQRDILKTIEDKYKFEKKVINPDLYQYHYYIYDNYDLVGLITTFIVDSKTLPNTESAMLSLSYVDVENYMNYESRKRNDI